LPARRANTRQTFARVYTPKNTIYLRKGKDAYVPY
jgi:hypothetical protein